MRLDIFRTNINACTLAALMSLGICAASCSDDNNNDDDIPSGTTEPESGATLSGIVRAGQTVLLREGRTFSLSGEYLVEDGGILRIEPGVTIRAINTDDTPDYIMIAQGGQIDAQGTASDPIVMTVENYPAEGASLGGNGWCGVHICGRAHTNKGTGTLSEIGGYPYGSGTSTANDTDNSGTMRYVRLECAGYAFTEETEANGLTLYGVGSGTTIDHIQVYRGADDGIEFFGGSVNVKYILITDCEDDSFDWTEGWNGKAQFLVADQRGTSGAADDGDCLIEADNNGDDNEATPFAHPILANLTLIGNNSQNGTRGIRLREGTQAEIYNAIVTGKPRSLTVESQLTEEALADGTSKLQYVILGEDFSTTEGIYTQDMFLAEGNHNQVSSASIPSFADDDFVGVIDGGTTLSDSFFTAAAYCGAVQDGDSAWNLTGSWIRR